MGFTSSDSSDLATYQFQGLDDTWFKQWKEGKGIKVGHIKFEDFALGFFD